MGIEELAKPIFVRGLAPFMKTPSMEAALPPATVADWTYVRVRIFLFVGLG